jgi:hypothetical protein
LFAPEPTYAAEILPGGAEALASGIRRSLDEQVAQSAAGSRRAASALDSRVDR